MLSASRALSLSWESAPELPRIGQLEKLYQMGVKFRQGQTMMIAGMPGAGKSAFALWLAAQWNLPTLYLSGDMSSFDASTRVASMLSGKNTEMVEWEMAKGGESAEALLNMVNSVNIMFAHDSPIEFYGADLQLAAFLEAWGHYPALIVWDNLMDIEGCDTDHAAQQSAMQEIVALGRRTGSANMVLHHVLESGDNDVTRPAPRKGIANKMSQKPELVLTTALNPHNLQFNVACVKQRGGRADPTASTYAVLQSYPETNRFGAFSLR